MSTEVHAEHGSAARDDRAHDDGHAHGPLRSYLIGFALSVVLTAIPFWLVMTGALAEQPGDRARRSWPSR